MVIILLIFTGFKEFHEFLKLPQDAADYENVKNEAIERMKIATRQYANKQVTWLQNKLCRSLVKEHAASNGALYVLNATNLEKWDTHISPRAVSLAEGFLNGRENDESATDVLPPR